MRPSKWRRPRLQQLQLLLSQRQHLHHQGNFLDNSRLLNFPYCSRLTVARSPAQNTARRRVLPSCFTDLQCPPPHTSWSSAEDMLKYPSGYGRVERKEQHSCLEKACFEVTLVTSDEWIYYSRIKKGESQGKKCHAWTIMHRKADKTFKRSAHHVPLRQTIQTKRYVWWTSDNCCLLWINKARAKEKTYILVSVRWKTKN